MLHIRLSTVDAIVAGCALLPDFRNGDNGPSHLESVWGKRVLAWWHTYDKDKATTLSCIGNITRGTLSSHKLSRDRTEFMAFMNLTIERAKAPNPVHLSATALESMASIVRHDLAPIITTM